MSEARHEYPAIEQAGEWVSGGELSQLVVEALDPHRVANAGVQLDIVGRLAQEVDRATLERLVDLLRLPVAGEHQDRNPLQIGMRLPPSQQLGPLAVAELPAEQHCIGCQLEHLVLGVDRGKILIKDRFGSEATIDLSDAVSLREVIERINEEPTIGVTASIVDDHLVLTDTSNGLDFLTVKEVGDDTTATDLGIRGTGVGNQLVGSSIYTLTGATALREGWTAIKAGIYDIVLAVGVEKLAGAGMLGGGGGGSKGIHPEGLLGSASMPCVFAEAGMAHSKDYGTTFEQFAQIAVKNHHHSTMNPKARYQIETPLEEVMGAEMISYPNTKLMCSVNVDGAPT